MKKKTDSEAKRGGQQTRYPGVVAVGRKRYRLRGKVTCPRTGRCREFERIVEAANIQTAAGMRLELWNELVAQQGAVDVPRTLGEWAVVWLGRRLSAQRSAKAGGGHRLAPGTRDRYRRAVENVIVPQIGHLRLDKVTRRDFEAWRDELGSQVRAATVNGHLRVLSAMLKDLDTPKFNGMRIRTLPEDDGLTTEDEPNLLSAEELQRFLDSAREVEPDHYPLILLLMTTGMRISTALALHRDDFEPANGIVVARRRLSGKEVVEGVKRSRTAVDKLPLLDEVWSAMVEHWEAGSPRQLASPLAFPSRTGGHHAKSVLRKPFAKILAEAGIEKRFTPHGCRRTAADLYRRHGGERVSMEIAGHLTSEMHRHYTQVDAKEKKDAASKAFGDLRLVEAPSGDPGGDPGRKVG